ncbi:hypothetical protein BDV95DRAFT_577930 [Massariosphaeria phaeospora]|uniref:J domain-containing protein n=1 Tax=Massariosphaeria phaeospora TaxID=100035 RepID=A0A7C8M557_9PLEO|nr:hypothetical protein BDV95DRAFT_577930 [Massariosphaeria phaeospora]
MLSRTPALLASYAHSARCYSPPRHAPQSCASCRHPHARPQSPRHTRSYAPQAAHDPSDASSPHCSESDLSWPDPVRPHRTPTPYQILQCSRGDVYTKQRFYSLVKLYHPDRCNVSSPIAHLPHAVRIERYRLLVAAHTILSDHAKRSAYDACGHGWAGHYSTPTPSSASPYESHTGQRQWPPGHDPAFNATWEDWERWYHREYGHPTEEPRATYMSNFAFVSLVFAFVTLGGIMQGTRANNFSSSVMEHRDKMHKEASIELARSKHMNGDRDARIRTFLEHRQAVLPSEDVYQRDLPPPATCEPDTVRKQ